ncbi:alpha-galactosidase [Amnibacterium soli]|uniref:alpha-galactosidase n=1 Tax=Amnibacterium soli TaxID=1282736 RepID=A0ABP8ZH22_9MICO
MLRLRVDDVSFVLGQDDRGLPVVLHFGAALGEDAAAELQATAGTATMHSSFDVPTGPTVAASGADGWSGTPAFEWHAAGVVPAALTASSVQGAADRAEVVLTEPRTGGRVVLAYRLHPSGVLEARAELHNDGSAVLDVTALRLLLPLPDRARELLDFTGAWSGERRPQRHDLADGTWLRAGRRGRTGHDAATLTSVGTSGFAHRSGEVWSAHLGWSGNGEVLVERLPEGAGPLGSLLGAGELLAPGEVRLAPGEHHATPSVFFAWSDRGLDGVAKRLHALVRSFPAHPASPRPLLLNSWEAVYFDHDLDRLLGLVRAAADLGVERFVLDDGWFLGRRSDSSGLGDWTVDRAVWPQGLAPLSDAVHAAGMQFGLWFEPEMVNPDSDLARAHPEWILADAEGAGRLWRNQQVLNLGEEACFAHVLGAIDRVVGEAGVDFIKWDHNRDLHEAVDRATGRAGVHRQTSAYYRMVDALRQRHPGLEIESCASGGARADLGVVQHAQRIWTSDTIDPLERQMIQRGLELLLPLELIGAHVGAARAHTTGRTTSLPFRLATALFGHSGIEADVTALPEEDRAAIAAWVALYREQRPLLHSGEVVHADAVPDGAALTGVVAADRGRALFQWVQLRTGRSGADPRTPFPGIDPAKRYRVRFREEIGRAARRGTADPVWCRELAGGGEAVLSGEVLGGPGVPLPALQPAEALLVELLAVE